MLYRNRSNLHLVLNAHVSHYKKTSLHRGILISAHHSVTRNFGIVQFKINYENLNEKNILP